MLLLYFKILIISQLISKTCNIIFTALRYWRQVCAIRNLHRSWSTLHKLRIAQTFLQYLGAVKMMLQVLLRSWEMMSTLVTNNNTWCKSVTNWAEMNNCWGFGQNVVQCPSPLCTYPSPPKKIPCSNVLRGTFKNLNQWNLFHKFQQMWCKILAGPLLKFLRLYIGILRHTKLLIKVD